MLDTLSLKAGIASGFCQTFVGYPLDTLKTWTQNSNISKKPNITLKNLYKGVSFPLMQSPFTVATGFFVNDNMYKYTNNIYLSAMSSGLSISFFLCPFDYYKIHYQQHKTPLFKNAYNRLPIVALREVPANLFYFSNYHNMRNNNISPGVSGAISGIGSWLITYPIDTIKSRMQLQNKLSFIAAMKEGNFFRGVGVTCARAAIVNYIGFEVYEYSRSLLNVPSNH